MSSFRKRKILSQLLAAAAAFTVKLDYFLRIKTKTGGECEQPGTTLLGEVMANKVNLS